MVASGHVEPDGVIAIVISLTLLACVFVGLKLYARLGMARIAGMDDLCVGISMVMFPFFFFSSSVFFSLLNSLLFFGRFPGLGWFKR